MSGTITHKGCSQCKAVKPVAEFSPLQSSKDGRRAYCRTCGRKYTLSYKVRNKGALAFKHMQWRALNRQHYRDYQRQYQRTYKLRKRLAAEAQEINTTPD